MAAQQPARASPELRKAPLSPRYLRNYTTSGDTTLSCDGCDDDLMRFVRPKQPIRKGF